MSGRTKRAAAVRATGCLVERGEAEIYSGVEQWGDDWKSVAEEATAAADESPPTKRQKARAPQTEGRDQPDDREQPQPQEQQGAHGHAETQRDVHSEVELWLRANRNQNTAAAYASSWRQFVKWTEETANPQRAAAAHVNLQRPSAADVASYMRHIVEVKGGTIQSVDAALAGISDKFRFTDHHPTSDALVRQMKLVLTPMAKPASQKREMAWELLTRVVAAAWADGTATGRRDAAMILLAYFGYLRGSEIARMQRKDIEIRAGTGGSSRRVLHVQVNRLCKNDAKRTGHERLVEEREETEICVLRTIEVYMQMQKQGDELDHAPLFPTASGEHMSASTPRGRLHHWLREIGEKKPTIYGFHSLRAGATTASAKAGVPERHIKQHGNWASDAVRVYIRMDDADRLRASGALGKGAKNGCEAQE